MFEFLHNWISAGGWSVAVVVMVIGFVALVWGADWLVDGASGLAKRFGVSNLIIGLTVVAFGTSMPEFMVNMAAAAQHNSEIAITNILGSNIINIFVILGITAIIYPISSTRNSRRFDIPWSLLAAVMVLFFTVYQGPRWLHVENLFDMQIQGVTLRDLGCLSWGNGNAGFISGIGGVFLIICMVVFMWHSIRFAKTGAEGDSYEEMKTGKALGLIAAGLVTLVVGGECIVDSATSIARHLGVSDAIIGLTVVALGTSLPELATSCVAAVKKNCDLALGNVIGSNIFNVFFILGVSAVIYPLPGYPGLEVDALVAALGSAIVMIAVYGTKKHEIKRVHGILLLIIYALYLTYRLVGIHSFP